MKIRSNFKEWRKTVKADLESFQFGRDDGVKKILSLIVTDVRQDGFLEGGRTNSRMYRVISGATIPRKSKPGNVFHHSKFVCRSGLTKKGFRDLSWSGDRGQNGADVTASVREGRGVLEVTGHAEKILRFHPVNRKTMHRIGEGSDARIAKSDRGIVQRSGRKVVREWNRLVKSAIDARLAKQDGKR